jgi:hypothetical protein
LPCPPWRRTHRKCPRNRKPRCRHTWRPARPQHAALAAAVGDYDLTILNWEAPGAAPTRESGSATRSMILDGRVMVEEVQATMMGMAFTGHGMVGFDNVSGKWWQTWNDSMSTGVMVSEGDCDDQGSCSFHGSWNDPVSRQKVPARFTNHWTDEDTEVFEMFGPGADGVEYKMMEMTYTRR